MSFFRVTFYKSTEIMKVCISFFIVLICFSIHSVHAQKLKLSKERKLELDSIQQTQQQIWQEELDQAEKRRKVWQAKFDSTAQNNPAFAAKNANFNKERAAVIIELEKVKHRKDFKAVWDNERLFYLINLNEVLK